MKCRVQQRNHINNWTCKTLFSILMRECGCIYAFDTSRWNFYSPCIIFKFSTHFFAHLKRRSVRWKRRKKHIFGARSLSYLHVNWKYVLSIWNVSVSELKKLLLLLLVLLPLLLPLLLLQQRLNRQRTFVFVLYLIQQHLFRRFYSIYIYTHTCTAMAAWMDGCTQLWMHFFHTLIIIVVYTFLGLRKKSKIKQEIFISRSFVVIRFTNLQFQLYTKTVHWVESRAQFCGYNSAAHKPASCCAIMNSQIYVYSRCLFFFRLLFFLVESHWQLVKRTPNLCYRWRNIHSDLK